jgi:hypothetical protein
MIREGDSASLRRAFAAADIDRFAALAGLPQGTVAPGAGVPEPLVGAMFSRLLGMDLPGPGTGWLKQRLEHHDRAAAGELLTATVRVVRLRPGGRLADLDCRCTGDGGRPICSGRALVLLPPAPG